MKLIYRGVSYDYESVGTQSGTANRTAQRTHQPHSPYRLSYRGSVYSVDPNAAPRRSIFHPIANLMYRGVAYSLNG